jgi:hypothetical protein
VPPQRAKSQFSFPDDYDAALRPRLTIVNEFAKLIDEGVGI